ncbi:hypothetical protein BX666DRAFT_2016435 [Dichotomocladium elegans]|nr:hypothetical protein BX666DRAFT_2016435 [Dichotomocladium elegans]
MPSSLVILKRVVVLISWALSLLVAILLLPILLLTPTTALTVMTILPPSVLWVLLSGELPLLPIHKSTVTL